MTLQRNCAKIVAQLLIKQKNLSPDDIKILPPQVKQLILDALTTMPIVRTEFLELLFTVFVDVESLTIDKTRNRHGPEITDADITKIVSKMDNLEKICFRGLKYLTLPAIKSDKITSIDLMDNKNQLFNPIGIDCPNLQILALNPQPKPLFRVLCKLCQSNSPLKVLDVSNSNITQYNLSPLSFSELEILNVMGCKELKNIQVQSKTLRVIRMAKAAKLTDAVIHHILADCPNIETLDLRECNSLQVYEKKTLHFSPTPKQTEA